MRKVSIDMLTPDMRLGLPVCNGMNILINAGVHNLDRYISRLNRLGIRYLYIEDNASEGIEIDELIKTETRLKCKETLHNSFKRLDSHLAVNVRELSGVTENLVYEILNQKNVLYNLNEIGGIGDNTLDHSLNTTIYAVCLGIQLRYSDSKIKELAMGTMLHDIGKTVLNHDILFKPGTLTTEEFEHVKTHTQLGYDLLSKDHQIPELTRQICLGHHERVDGSGYPNGLTGERLPDFVKIASIVDVYEALTVNRCYHDAITPLQASEVLTEEASTKLDFQLTRAFIQNIAIYPTGTNVLLSDGRYAIVKEQNQSFPLRPIVRVVEMKDKKCIPKEEIDLMSKLNLTIVDSDMTIPTS